MSSKIPKTLYQKLVASHTVATLDAQNVLFFCDLHLMNEYTNPQAFAGLHEQGRAMAQAASMPCGAFSSMVLQR